MTKRYMRRYGSFSDGTLWDNVLEKRLDYLEVETLVNEQAEDIIRLENKVESLLDENDQYRKILQDLGLLRSDADVIAIRNEIAEKIIKPVFQDFDVDVDISDGFEISLKDDDVGERFKIYNKETLDTYIEDTKDLYSDGTPKTYWFGENEDFCDLFVKLNKLSDDNDQLKQELEDLKFAHRTEMALHRVIESELKEKIAKRDYTSSKLYGGD